mgnify:CR=1 FL=1
MHSNACTCILVFKNFPGVTPPDPQSGERGRGKGRGPQTKSAPGPPEVTLRHSGWHHSAKSVLHTLDEFFVFLVVGWPSRWTVLQVGSNQCFVELYHNFCCLVHDGSVNHSQDPAGLCDAPSSLESSATSKLSAASSSSSSSSYFISKVRHNFHTVNTSTCTVSVPRGLPEKPKLISAGRPLEKFNTSSHHAKELRTTQKLQQHKTTAQRQQWSKSTSFAY